MLAQVSVAAATAVVGYDLLRDSIYRQSQLSRRIVALGLRGSAAALDTQAKLMVGQRQVATIFNDATGAPNRDAMFRVGEPVPAGAEVSLIIEDAPATNPINAAVDFEV